MTKKSSKKSENLNNDKALATILENFDKESKMSLALKLVEEFNLNEDGEPFTKQMELILGRKLTADESFKVDTLNRMLKFHGGGGGGGIGADPAPPPPPN